jgi:murein DD-endopeptidase MepM/ murein hydrolase activator NlpD
VTTPEAPPVAEWNHPARLGGSTPAVRLDRPRPPATEEDESSACGDGCEEAPAVPRARDGSGARGPAGGARVSLQPGMTLYSLSRAYHVPLETILRANGIDDPTTIRAGTEIYIPSARGESKKTPAKEPIPETAETSPSPGLMSIAWPIDGLITGGFGRRGRHHHHDGIDIDGVRGEEVHAVAAGIVVRSGYDGNYGKTVVLDHGNGVTTLYAHASRLRVREGDEVEQGETIAEVGATGNARGTHLHFEVRRNGHPVDPIPYLRPGMVGAARSSGSRADADDQDESRK